MEYHDNATRMSTSDLKQELEFRLKQLNYWIDYRDTLCIGDDALIVAKREINWFLVRLKTIRKELANRGN